MSCRIRRTQMMAHGGLCEKPADPKMKADLDSKLAQMQAERTKQDQLWTTTYETGKIVSLSTDKLNAAEYSHNG
jgi:hypothetical protein